MTEPTSDPGGFPGFDRHLERHLGPIRYAESAQAQDGRNRGYALACCVLPDPGVVSICTNGLRFQRLSGAPLAQELVCSLRVDQEKAARYLVDLVAFTAVRGGRATPYDQVITGGGGPLLPDTAITGLLAMPSPFFGGAFDLVRDGDGQPVLAMVTLVPVTAAEAEYVAEADAEELYDIWREQRVNILDVNRRSAL